MQYSEELHEVVSLQRQLLDFEHKLVEAEDELDAAGMELRKCARHARVVQRVRVMQPRR